MRIRVLSILRTMGLRYVGFRLWHESLRATGMLKLLYSTRPGSLKTISIREFSENGAPFLPMDSSGIPCSDHYRRELEAQYHRILSGEYPFFSGQYFGTGHHDWLTNPCNGYRYDKSVHWTNIKDIDPAVGDIKFVWERARFSWVYTLLRADRVLGTDSLRFLVDSMLSFIRHSPINCGPHWRCGQELSLRVLNWIAILHFYRDRLGTSMTEVEFNTIIGSIHDQMVHVYRNRRFARIAVRNNHAITEALGLFATGLLFKWFPKAQHWLCMGERYLEEEAVYQFYIDGTYIQHSFNYHRVAIQLYTWALALAKVNGLSFSQVLEQRLRKSIDFMTCFIDAENGQVPNWGANDSALFFPLNNCGALDFRPQVNALNILLHNEAIYRNTETLEDCFWWCGTAGRNVQRKVLQPFASEFRAFDVGGYYIIRNRNTHTFIRCAKNRHRPFHADNLHVDIRIGGHNIIRDAGTFSYNTDPSFHAFFAGTAGHNAVMIDGADQMANGSRFVWYGWSVAEMAGFTVDQDAVVFEGRIRAFKQLQSGILHHRIVNVLKEHPVWVIRDRVSGTSGHTFSQHWNIADNFETEGFTICSESDGTVLVPESRAVWYSELYGRKTPARQIVFSSSVPEFTTIIYHASALLVVKRLQQ